MLRPLSCRRHCLSLAGVLLLACVPLGCKRAAAPAEEKAPPAPVKWEEPRQVVLEEWAEFVGSTEPLPDHAARVTAPVEGAVLSVLGGAAGKPVVEGQPVEAGQVLVQLEDTVLRNQRSKALAAKKVLEAEKEANDFAIKLADLEVRRLNALRAQDESQRSGSAPRVLVSAVELEKAALTLEAAKAHGKADERKLEAADDEIAALDRQLKLYTLTAPRKGRLGRLQVGVGDTLHVGTLVAEIVDIEGSIDVLCFVSATDARRLQLGQTARVGGLGLDKGAPAGVSPAAADVEGKVEYIADQAEPDTGQFAVKVRFPNRDLKLLANAVVRIRVLIKPGKACWAVPEAALIEDQDPPSLVVAEDVAVKKNADGKDEQVGTARRLRAVLGVRDRVLRQVEIVRLEDPEKKWKGDLESAKIVVEKGQGLQTGDPVRLEEEED
jgi:RND family efflux transporter MFP subunit